MYCTVCMTVCMYVCTVLYVCMYVLGRMIDTIGTHAHCLYREKKRIQHCNV